MALPPPVRMRMEDMPNEALDQVAAYFQALSEPTRLQILNFLREGERNVGELANSVRLYGGEHFAASGHVGPVRTCVA